VCHADYTRNVCAILAPFLFLFLDPHTRTPTLPIPRHV
jgi:hypothetical protein